MLTLTEWAQSFEPWRKPWLLLGKGPSFDRLPQVDQSRYFVCSLNHVVREVEVTLAHAIDLDVVVSCAEAIERNARFLVLPYRPHVGFDPGPRTVFDLQDEIPALGRLSRAGRLVYYDLSSAPPSGASPRIEARFFSAEAALELLAVSGAREVRSLGIDGGTSYSRAFGDLEATTKLANGRSSFDRQFEQIAALLRRHDVTFAPWGVEAPVRVFVGADPAQRLPAQVLEWSLKRHASLSVSVQLIDDSELPVPARPEHRSRTGFSFARFKIPARCDRRGRALYLDADMLALDDVARLWATSLGDASLAFATQPPGRESARHSVMLLDCARLGWDAAEIVRGLDRGDYDYEELLGELCIVPSHERAPLLPSSWNTPERVDEGTCLVHFTDMPTQPWVTPGHPHGHVWYSALREALAEGFVSEALLAEEIARGHVSPDLPEWLGLSRPRDHAQLRARWVPPFVRLRQRRRAGLDQARAAVESVRQTRVWRRLTRRIVDAPSYGEELAAAPEVRGYPFRREESKPGFGPLRARFEGERALFVDGAAGPPVARLVVLLRGAPGAALEETLRLWELQSCPWRDAVVLVREGAPQVVRAWLADRRGSLTVVVDALPTSGLPDDAFLVFALPGDRPHPSLATTLHRLRASSTRADLVCWHAQGPGAAGSWDVMTSPDREPITLWNTPLPRRALAISVGWARRYPGDLPRAAEALGGHLLALWASREDGLRWVTHPEFLTVWSAAPEPTFDRAALVAEATSHLADCPSVSCVAASEGPLPWRVAPEPRATRVSVIVPFREAVERTCAALGSVLEQATLAPCELVLVAHRTEPASLRRVEAFLAGRGVAPDRVRWVPYQGPFNHSLQCDLGVRAATGEVLLFLNNDARLLDDAVLQSLADWALLPGVGTVGCRMVGRDGRLTAAGVRTVESRPHPWSSGVEESRDESHAEATRETFANSFSCAAVARATYEAAGPLDATWFPVGYNDVEYCLRLRRRGLRHVFVGRLRCEHEAGGSRVATDELPQLLELRRRYPELAQLGELQLARVEVSAAASARGVMLRAQEELRAHVPFTLKRAAAVLRRRLRRR